MFAFDAQQLLEWADQFNRWLRDVGMQYGYFGIFLMSLIGASSIIIPVPYTIVIFTIGSMHILDPVLIAIAGGIGSAIGEFAGYFLGYFGRAVISKERQNKMNCMLRIFNRYGAFTIFLFALTPLPDDLLFIPLGMMRYSFVRALIPCILGKILMIYVVAYGGSLSNSFIQSIFGEGGGLWTTIVTVILLIVIIVVMCKVDWEKVIPLKEEDEKNKKKG